MSQTGSVRFVRTLSLAVRILVELWVFQRTSRFRGRGKDQAARRLYTRQARRFVTFAQRMGGLVIKVGQFLSVRIDLLPDEYIRVLAELQDALPGVATPAIIEVVERELDKPLTSLYASFDDTPVAAASLGQVHRATLKDGTDVAVKVLRPGIEGLVATDLRTIHVLLRLLDRVTTFGRHVDVAQLEADFTATFTDELDYLKEARHAETFQRNLLFNDHVDIPRIYWELTTRRVLTMEYMGGVPIDDFAGLERLGVDRAELARNLGGLFFEMVLNDGFFHADPHPGNVFVREGGIIELIDFGMVASVSEEARDQYARLVLGLVRRDADGIVSSLRELGFLGPGADAKRLAGLLGPYIDTIVGDVTGFVTGRSMLDAAMSGGIPLNIDSDTLRGLQEFIYTQPIVLPGQTTFLGKSLITIIGICLRLDPQMDLLATAAPYVTGRGSLADPGEWVMRLINRGTEVGRDFVPTARRFIAAAKRLADGSMEADLAGALERQIREGQRRQTRQLAGVIAGVGGVVVLVLTLGRRGRGT